jgi:hypothetical protein
LLSAQFDGKSIGNIFIWYTKEFYHQQVYTWTNDDTFASIETWINQEQTIYWYNGITWVSLLGSTTFNEDGSVRNNNKTNEIKYDDSKPGKE